MRRRAADFSTGHHEPKVLRFAMLATRLKTVRHGCAQAFLITVQTSFDARHRGWAAVMHNNTLVDDFRVHQRTLHVV